MAALVDGLSHRRFRQLAKAVSKLCPASSAIESWSPGLAGACPPLRCRSPRIAAHALHEQPDAPAALRQLAERAADLARWSKGVGFRRPYPRDRLSDVAVVTPEHGQMIIVVG